MRKGLPRSGRRRPGRAGRWAGDGTLGSGGCSTGRRRGSETATAATHTAPSTSTAWRRVGGVATALSHGPEPQPCAIARMHMAPPQRGAAAAHPSRLEQPASVGAPGAQPAPRLASSTPDGHAPRGGSSPPHAAPRHPPCPATQACCSRTSSTSHAAATRSGRCSRSSGPSGRARSWAARCSPCASGSSAPASPLPHPCLSRPRLAAPAQHRPSAIPGERRAQCAPRAALPRGCPPGLPRPRVLERRSAPPVQSPTPPPSTVQVLLVVAWLVVQARKLCGRRGEPPEERRSENADSDSD